MTEHELRRAATAAEQREQDRQAQYLRDQQRQRDHAFQVQCQQRTADVRSAVQATFGPELEHDLGGRYHIVGDRCLMDVVYDVLVADVALRIRQVRDEVHEPWVCEAVASGTQVPVKTVPDRVEVNRDRLLLALHTVYASTAGSAGSRERAGGASHGSDA